MLHQATNESIALLADKARLLLADMLGEIADARNADAIALQIATELSRVVHLHRYLARSTERVARPAVMN